MTTATPALEGVVDAGRAELLLHPLRQRILTEADEASTASDIARRLGLPPQKVNYHVRALVDAGFLEPAGEGRKRNLVEKLYRRSAASYVLLPQVLGEVAPGPVSPADRFSAAYLLHLSALLQTEVSAWLRPGEVALEDVPTMSLEAELRFRSRQQRAAFAKALTDAVAGVIRDHADPAWDPAGDGMAGRPYRLVLGCYPVPDSTPDETPLGGGG